MTQRVVPPFPVRLRVRGEVARDPEAVSLRELREAVQGRRADFAPASAMAMLVASDFPNVHRELEAVLADEQSAPAVRRAAALNLAKLGNADAVTILEAHTAVGSARVRAAVVKALARCGRPESIEAIERAAEDDADRVVEQARFAAALIAHRFGLDGHGLPKPDPADLLALPDDDVEELRVEELRRDRAELFLRLLGRRPFGVELLEAPMYALSCAAQSLVLALNHEIWGSLADLARRKALVGLVASRVEVTASYTVTYLVLTAPGSRDGNVDVWLLRSHGGLEFAGEGAVEGDALTFAVRAASRPGAFAASIAGRLGDDGLALHDARVTRGVVVPKREPRPYHRAS